jgi:hypothetical protein
MPVTLFLSCREEHFFARRAPPREWCRAIISIINPRHYSPPKYQGPLRATDGASEEPKKMPRLSQRPKVIAHKRAPARSAQTSADGAAHAPG